MAYQAFILLPAGSDVSIEAVYRELENSFFDDDDERDVSFETAEDRLTMTIDDWNLYVYLDSEPYVAEQSRELADSFAKDRPDKDEIAASSIRLEISSDDDDSLEYFNDFLLTAEILGQFKGAKVWEGASEKFLDV